MKTSIKNIIAASLTAIVLTTTSAFAADPIGTQKSVTVLNDIKNFSKIKVSGNVEVILVQGADQGVKVYDNYYSKNAFVQQKNGELFISSFDKETLTVVAYVNELSAITATDNASVKTFGKLDVLGLDVKLLNNATADLNVATLNLKTNVADSSVLTLSGKALELNANIESVAKVNMDKFSAEATNIKARNMVAKSAAIQEDVLVELGK